METRWRIDLFGNLCARQESAAERSLPHSPGSPGADPAPRPGHPAHGEGLGEAETPVRALTRFQTKTGTLLAYLAPRAAAPVDRSAPPPFRSERGAPQPLYRPTLLFTPTLSEL